MNMITAGMKIYWTFVRRSRCCNAITLGGKKPGRVVEVKGDRALVKLEGNKYALWKPLRELKARK
jgi:hypothetical protein